MEVIDAMTDINITSTITDVTTTIINYIIITIINIITIITLITTNISYHDVINFIKKC